MSFKALLPLLVICLIPMFSACGMAALAELPADSQMVQGDILASEGKDAEAIQAYQQAVKIDPKFEDAYIGMANAYLRLNMSNEAIEPLQKVLVINPDNAPAKQALVLAHYKLGVYYENGCKRDANGTVACSHRFPTDEPVVDDMDDEALASFEEALSIDPRFVLAHCGLGRLYDKHRNFNAALIAFNEAISLNPKETCGHFGLGFVYGRQGKHDDAIMAYEEVVAIDPGDQYAYLNMGMHYMHLGKTSMAIEAMEKARDLDLQDSTRSTDWIELADVYQQAGEFEKAIVLYEETLEVHDSSYSHLQLGLIYEKQGNLNKALASFKQALATRPDYLKAQKGIERCEKALAD